MITLALELPVLIRMGVIVVVVIVVVMIIMPIGARQKHGGRGCGAGGVRGGNNGLGCGLTEDGFQLAAIEPHAFAARAQVNFEAVFFDGAQTFVAHWTVHGINLHGVA